MLPTSSFPLESPAVWPPPPIQPLESAAATSASLRPDDLRAYQHALADIVVSPGNFILSIPTGMGKTIIAWHVVFRLYRAYSLAARNPSATTFLVLIVAPTIELCNQHALTIREYADAWGAKELIVRNLNTSGAFYPFFRKTIAVATPGKVMALLGDVNNEFGLDQVQVAIVDEAHNAAKAHVMVELAKAIRDHNHRIRIEYKSGKTFAHPIKVIGLSATVARVRNTSDRAVEQLIARTKELEQLLDNAQLIALNDMFHEHVRDDFEAHRNEVTVIRADYVPAICDSDLSSVFTECWKHFLASTGEYANIDVLNGAQLAKKYMDDLKTCISAPMSVILPVVVRTPMNVVESFVRSVRNKFMDIYKARLLAANYDDEGIPPPASQAELTLQRAACFGTLAILTLKYGPRVTIPFISNSAAPLYLSDNNHLAPIADSMLSLIEINKETDLMRRVYQLVQSELHLGSPASHAVPGERVLIFNTTQEDALWTAYLINSHFNRPLAAALVGANVTRSELKRDMPAKVIDSAFRDKPVAALCRGEVLVLVSTTVAEEGIDVPACSLVVRMDTVGSGVQVGQSKGRARQRDGRMVVLCPNRNATELGASKKNGWVFMEKGYEAQRLEDAQRMLKEMHNVTDEISRENVERIITMRDVCGSDAGDDDQATDGVASRFQQVAIHGATTACWHPRPSLTPRGELETLMRLIGFAEKDFSGVFAEAYVDGVQRFKVTVTMAVPVGLQAQLGGNARIIGQSDWSASKKDAKWVAYNQVLTQVVCPDHELHVD